LGGGAEYFGFSSSGAFSASLPIFRGGLSIIRSLADAAFLVVGGAEISSTYFSPVKDNMAAR